MRESRGSSVFSQAWCFWRTASRELGRWRARFGQRDLAATAIIDVVLFENPHRAGPLRRDFANGLFFRQGEHVFILHGAPAQVCDPSHRAARFQR